MKSIITLLVVLCLSISATAQVKSLIGPSKIHYKDRSVFRGEILELNQVRIKFLISSSDTLTLLHDQIKKFTRLKIKPDRFYLDSGTFVQGNFGIPVGNFTGLAELIVATRLSPRWAVGLMGGYHLYQRNTNYNSIEQDFINLSGYARFALKDGWFLEGKAGYSFKSKTTTESKHRLGGPAFQPAFGFIFPSRNRFRLMLSVSQAIQYTRGIMDDYRYQGHDVIYFQNKYEYWYSRTLLKIGLEFG